MSHTSMQLFAKTEMKGENSSRTVFTYFFCNKSWLFKVTVIGPLVRLDPTAYPWHHLKQMSDLIQRGRQAEVSFIPFAVCLVQLFAPTD